MKKALIDTDILSYYLRGEDEVVEQVINYLNVFPSLNLSSITFFEILKGLEHKEASKQIKDFEEFASNCNLINVDLNSLKISAKVHGALKRKGKQIGIADILIAGIAIQNDLALITNNVKHFENIDNLKIENWKK